MKGPLFEKLLLTGEVTLSPKESVNDLEAMYSIIIEKRGKTAETMTAFDEEIALAVLCKIAWPGKPPSYRRGMNVFMRAFHGIARSSRLQKAFRERIKETLSTASAPGEISFERPSSIFKRARPSKSKLRSPRKPEASPGAS
jgi:hypothetical protein